MPPLKELPPDELPDPGVIWINHSKVYFKIKIIFKEFDESYMIEDHIYVNPDFNDFIYLSYWEFKEINKLKTYLTPTALQRST